jgi:hypothetical protein
MKILLLFSISFAFAKVVIIDSSVPGAQIFHIDERGSKNLLGKTPYKNKNGEGLVNKHLVIEKKGHIPVSLVIPGGLKAENSFNISLPTLDSWLTENQQAIIQSSSTSLVDEIVHAQYLLDSRKTKDAEFYINKLTKKYPDSLAVKILNANLFFVKGNRRTAKNEFKEIYNEIPSTHLHLKEMVEKFLKQLKK